MVTNWGICVSKLLVLVKVPTPITTAGTSLINSSSFLLAKKSMRCCTFFILHLSIHKRNYNVAWLAWAEELCRNIFKQLLVRPKANSSVFSPIPINCLCMIFSKMSMSCQRKTWKTFFLFLCFSLFFLYLVISVWKQSCNVSLENN